MFYNVKKNIRSYCYDKIQEHSTGTPILYRKVLNIVIPKSSILEIGIGNGICIDKNADIIKEKALMIQGIDIDKEYLEVCKARIMKNNISDNVSCHFINFLNMNEEKKYDYILYSGSYPVISEKIISSMLEKSKKLLENKNSQIIFSHSLYIEEGEISNLIFNILNFAKKNLKYIPLIWTDFGRMSSVKEFEAILKKHNLYIENKIEIDSNVEKENVIKKYLLKLVGITFKNKNYIYSVRKLEG